MVSLSECAFTDDLMICAEREKDLQTDLELWNAELEIRNLKINVAKSKVMTNCQEDDVSTYVQHLNALYSDFESRFEDILTMVIPPWIINPYGDIEETNVIIQEELTELSTNEELKVQFKNGYQQFWLQNNIHVTYPVLWNIATKFLNSFPSSYLVERGFSAVTNLLTKKRNRLDIISRGDLRLTLTKLTPNVDNLLLKHQVHPSH
ncbi:unnamed protein product [Acanthoscelides obtectus]|uniref:SCAN domain-containing protein 3 n=1 Tax=Acanthoscelides obtectus TaxID=200917 RepID=A0A9P0LSZ9_ACAOB|nr:unnamed protein product [Acanthoscelides obtectus]CAK1670413.1 SCAN domain-containing protein 3 [Acanthoscelides obtectus]